MAILSFIFSVLCLLVLLYTDHLQDSTRESKTLKTLQVLKVLLFLTALCFLFLTFFLQLSIGI